MNRAGTSSVPNIIMANMRIASWTNGTPVARTRCSHFAALQFQAA
ncbi:hypothetical protein GRAN_5108 [Granulicella sibirica]|uniref:Uncharacterized protein n=1 Tax=Granulicella sibirica TaxID=2479048 RepID=A0A4Q0SV07_9BACT|nr:hypothetical protein GRAN_5108 [Granulicella sibirica]